MSTLSERQREILAAVRLATRARPDVWYRAGQAGIGHPRGEAVTLASLERRGILQRRAWRTGKCSADNAYEYRIAVFP